MSYKLRNTDNYSIKYLKGKILKWASNNRTDFPWRFTDNRWHALVAEIMLQRTNAEQVLPVYNEFISRYENPTGFLGDIGATVFSGLGLHWREKQFLKLAEILSDHDIPESSEELKRLPCVGDYISAAYRSLHLGLRDVIIDSNVVRIYGRFFGFETDGETRRKKWLKKLADEITPKRKFREFNYGIIDFTRLICKPRPNCPDCILKRKCQYYSNN